ncbi:voltage-dependent calcium channel gamma-5 subunit isoform X2 [Onthophagus taurus]|uniref:voltage-dependent calcium channel gamma-5 subunit isoform X2 n=1 Tax=Onthophagus taurus TaxID=166361 RepID=UPI0039BE753F
MHRTTPKNAECSSASNDDQNFKTLEDALPCLWILSPLIATVSLVVVLVSVFTSNWLQTEEKMPNPSYNGTGDKEYLSKMTVSGLWLLCITNRGTFYECSRIDYFSSEEYSPDPNDSTMAIPYAVTKSAGFFVVATLLLCCSYCCCIIGHCAKHRGLYTFISGVLFIITGLSMLTGLVIYISLFKAEIGGKLRPVSLLQPPIFTYRYGYSFALFLVGFISCQITGISTIFLFIHRMQASYRIENGQETGKFHVPAPSNYCHVDSNSIYCRRHPNAYINSNSIRIPTNYPPPAHQKRFFFSKEPLPESPCSLHRHQSLNSGNSLKDVSGFYDFPPPPTISYQFNEPFSGPEQRFNHRLSRDVTTNTVSTTADVVTSCDEDFLQDNFVDYSPSVQHDVEFVTFDLDRPLVVRAHSNVSINSNCGDLPTPPLRKDYTTNFDPLRRTTPV